MTNDMMGGRGPSEFLLAAEWPGIRFTLPSTVFLSESNHAARALSAAMGATIRGLGFRSRIEDEMAESFPERLKRLRLATGLSQAKLAVKVGLTVQGYYQFECGRRKPSLANARRLAAAFGVKVDDLGDPDT
jgi:DNA-binding XRE family transcriptional regulator